MGAHGGVEQDDRLRDVPDAALPLPADGVDGPAVDEDLALIRLQQPQQDVDQRALPRAGTADEPDGLTLLDRERDAFEDRNARHVGEAHVARRKSRDAAIDLHLLAGLERRVHLLALRQLQVLPQLVERGHRRPPACEMAKTTLLSGAQHAEAAGEEHRDGGGGGVHRLGRESDQRDHRGGAHHRQFERRARGVTPESTTVRYGPMSR